MRVRRLNKQKQAGRFATLRFVKHRYQQCRHASLPFSIKVALRFQDRFHVLVSSWHLY